MNICHVQFQVALLSADLWTKVTLKGLNIAKSMHIRQVYLQMAFLCTNLGAYVTFEGLYVTNTVNILFVFG